MRSLICCISLFLIVCQNICLAQNSWSGNKEKWTKGIGTAFDPFLIETAENLAYLGENGTSEGKYFLVKNDMNLGGKEWTPICSFSDAPFKGHIDFGNHTISGLNVSTDRSAGLFGYIENASVTNVVFDQTCNVRGCNLAGMLAGNAISSEFDNLKNYGKVFSYGDLSSTGGMIGQDKNSTITNAMNNGEVENSEQISESAGPIVYVGGIVGNGQGTRIQQCCNTGYIHGYSDEATANYNVGGIVGNCSGSISYCYNTGKCMSRLRYVRWYNDGTKAYISGICGGLSNATVSNCYCNGEISGCSYWSGLYSCILCSDATQSDCYSTWNIVGCEADSYTAQIEKWNGVKVSSDELNGTYVVSKLNDGTGLFIKDEYPYVNNAAPILSTIRQISVKTDAASDVKPNSAVLNGAFFAPGYNINKRGFLIKAKGAFEFDTIYTNTNYKLVENLTPGKRYVYRFFVADADDDNFFMGDEAEFVTSSIKSEVYTLETSNITSNSVELKGAILLDASESLLSYGFYYQEDGGGEIEKINATSFEDVYFTAHLQNLKASTKYSYWAYASLSVGELSGDVRYFNTEESTGVSECNQPNGIKLTVGKGSLTIENTGYEELLISIFTLDGKLVKCLNMGNGAQSVNLNKGIYIVGKQKVAIP